MKEFELSSEEIDKELQVDNSSIFALVEELKNHSRKESKYSRFAANANKIVSELSLQLKIIEAELVEEEMKKQSSSSASLRQEIRKSIVKEPKYREAYLALSEAQETSDIMRGLVNSWVGRGYQLREIAKLAGYTMSDGPKVYVGSPYKKSEEALDKLEE